MYFIRPTELNDVTIDLENGVITGFIDNSDNLLKQNNYFYICKKNMELGTFDIALALDLSNSMRLQDTEQTMEWVDAIKNIMEQTSENSRYGLVNNMNIDSVLTNDVTSIQNLLEMKKEQGYTGSVNIQELFANAKEILNNNLEREKIIVATYSNYSPDQDEKILNIINEAKQDGINVYLILFTTNDALQLCKNCNNVILCTDVRDISIKLASLYGTFANFRSADSIMPIIEETSNKFTSDFIFGVDNYSIRNFSNGAYSINGGHCTGFALTSILNMYHRLPARVVFSTYDDQRVRNRYDLYNNAPTPKPSNIPTAGSDAYNLFDSNAYKDNLTCSADRDLYRMKDIYSDNNYPPNIDFNSLRGMMSYWWVKANDLEDEGKSQNSLGYSYVEDTTHKGISNDTVERIKELIEKRMPVQIGIFQMYKDTMDSNGITNYPASENAGHSVVITSYRQIDANNLEFEIYDSNYDYYSTRRSPNITMTRKNNGDWDYIFAWNGQFTQPFDSTVNSYIEKIQQVV